MATNQDYQVGDVALLAVMNAAVKAQNVPFFMQAKIQSLVDQIAAQGAKAVVDAVDASRAKQGET